MGGPGAGPPPACPCESGPRGPAKGSAMGGPASHSPHRRTHPGCDPSYFPLPFHLSLSSHPGLRGSKLWIESGRTSQKHTEVELWRGGGLGGPAAGVELSVLAPTAHRARRLCREASAQPSPEQAEAPAPTAQPGISEPGTIGQAGSRPLQPPTAEGQEGFRFPASDKLKPQFSQNGTSEPAPILRAANCSCGHRTRGLSACCFLSCPGWHPSPGIGPGSRALQADSSPLSHQGSPT